MTTARPTVITVPATSSASGTGGEVKTSSAYPIVVNVIAPILFIGVRALRVYLQTILGLLTAGTVLPDLLPAADFMSLLSTSASLSVAAAGICVLQNMVELLTKLDQKTPRLTL
jgi:hypothetical protein